MVGHGGNEIRVVETLSRIIGSAVAGRGAESLKLHPQVVDFAGVAAFRRLSQSRENHQAERGRASIRNRWQLVVEYDAERSQKISNPAGGFVVGEQSL